MAAKPFMTVKITAPDGAEHTVTVKKSMQVEIEEDLGAPLFYRLLNNFYGARERVLYEVGQRSDILPKTLTWVDFMDEHSDLWKFEVLSFDVLVADDEGNS